MRSLPLVLVPLLLATTATAGAAGDPVALSFTSGAPVRFQAEAAFDLGESTLALVNPEDGSLLPLEGASFWLVETRHATAAAPGAAAVEHDFGPTSLSLTEGAVRRGLQGADAASFEVDAVHAKVTSARSSDHDDAWNHANAQLSTLIASQSLAAAHPESKERLLAPGTYRLVAHDASVEAQLVAARATDLLLDVGDESIRVGDSLGQGAGSVPHLDPATQRIEWTGPGTHTLATTSHLLIVYEQPIQWSASVDEATAWAADVRVEALGRTVFPWADGDVARFGTLNGQQLQLEGDYALNALRADTSAAPQITWLGHGVIHNLVVGGATANQPSQVPPEAVAIAAGLGAATLAAAAAYYASQIKWLAAGLFAPLYARLAPERVLDHGGRERVYAYVKQDPGVSTHELSQRVQFGWSTLSYHLRVLEKTGKVVSVRDGRYKRFFDRESGLYANGRKLALAALRNATTRRVAQAIRIGPGTTQKQLSSDFGLTPSSIHWHVQRLQEAQLLERRRDGHWVRYYPGPAWVGVDAAKGVHAAASGPDANPAAA